MLRRTLPALLALAVAVAGCGSTAQVTGRQQLGAGLGGVADPGLGTAAGGTSGAEGSTSVPGTQAGSITSGRQPTSGGPSSAAVGGPGGPGGPGATQAPVTGAPRAGAGKLPANHRGVNATTIKLGFLYLASAGTVVGAFGVKGYSQGDELGEFRALVADQNARGGVAGRKLEVVPRDLGGVDESSYQAACTFFTQDSPVFMVFTALGHVASLNTCLAKHSVGYTSNYIAPSDRLMRGLGPIYAPDDIAAERYAALLGHSLVDAHFFGAGAKVGIIHSDTQDYRRLTKEVLRPILARAGVNVVAEEEYNSTDASQSSGDTAGVVFRLRQKGVTHVVSYESPLLYMTAAESQQWRPWWAVTSRAGPGSFLEGAAPAAQLKKTMGPGWQQVSDLATARIKGPVNSEEARCLGALAKAGYSYTGTPRYVAQMICGELYHFVRSLAIASEVSTAGFRTAAEHLPSYPSPMTFGMSFAGGRHDGASLYRIVAWRDACSCYQYTSPLRPIPTT